MNNDLNEHQLESLLRGLAPSAASPTLARRVDEELKLDMSWLSTGNGSSRRKSHQLPRWLMSTGWAAMGAAAAIAVMSYLPQPSGSTGRALATTTSAMLPAASSTLREWDSAKTDGIHRGRSLASEKPALVISRELQTWVDPRYAAETTVQIRSQQQLLQPVSYR